MTKTNIKPQLSACCGDTMRVEGDDSPLGGTMFHVCNKCDKACDPQSTGNPGESEKEAIPGKLVKSDVVKHGLQAAWEEQYPLNTFSGETKRELVEFVRNKMRQAFEDGQMYTELREKYYKEGGLSLYWDKKRQEIVDKYALILPVIERAD